MSEELRDDEAYRDTISTVDSEGKRVWIYPKKPKGKYFNARTWVSVFLLTLLFAGPFIKIDGEALLMLNIIERKFIILGQIFWPQDFNIFVFVMITMVVFIILFTVIFGRIFCGWICPQTIFMEMVFRRIEYWIEGDWKHQKKLNKDEWDTEKIRKKVLKHVIFFIISFLIGNISLAYIIGAEDLFAIIIEPPLEHIGGLFAMLSFTLVFYGVFAHLREQVCTTICPYGRLQGVLMDKQTIVVAYDHVRGEGDKGRGKWRKGEDREEVGKGDCIDCNRCVDVCPTGIDIRNGTQLECVNCTACIDECNFMMDSVGLEPNLIRYDSEVGIAEKQPLKFNTRIKSYTAVLVLLIIALGVMVLSRTDVETTVLRTSGKLFYERGESEIYNLYNYKLINKTKNEMDIVFKIEDGPGYIEMVGEAISIEKHGIAEGVLFIVMDKSDVSGMKNKVNIGVYQGDIMLEEVKSNFLGPIK